MRKFTFFLAFFSLLSAQASIHLTFKATDALLHEVVVVYQTTVQNVPLDSTGHGELTLEDISAVHAQLFYGMASRNFFMEEGDSLVFTFSGKDFAGTLTLEGPKVRIFRYLNTIRYTAPDEKDYALPFDKYRAVVAEHEKAAKKILDAWKFEKVSPQFAIQEAGRLHYGYAQNLMMYKVGHPMLAQEPNWKPGEDYLTAIREDATEHPELAGLRDYREYMKEAARILDPKAVSGSSFYERTIQQINWMADHIKNDTLRETLINVLAVEYVDQVGTDSITELNNLQATYVTIPALIHDFERACEVWNRSASGKLSPDFVGTDLKGQKHALADFKGHYVYIDLWATWCGPCRVEFPHLRKLEEVFKDKNIIFLGLSIDKDVAAWRKVAPTLGETQLHIGPDNSFLTAYKIKGIPRFILLDTEGKIINNDMSRPSSPDTRATLLALPDI